MYIHLKTDSAVNVAGVLYNIFTNNESTTISVFQSQRKIDFPAGNKSQTDDILVPDSQKDELDDKPLARTRNPPTQQTILPPVVMPNTTAIMTPRERISPGNSVVYI